MREFDSSALALKPASLQQNDVVAAATTKVNRLKSVDIQRGLIMILMAFSHSHEYIGADSYSNTDPGISPAWQGHSWLDVFQQIFASTFVAGGFYMLMGVGIYFLWQARKKKGSSAGDIVQYLFTRGAVMILLQLTFIQLFQYISTGQLFFYAGVLMSLGFCMMGAALCMWVADNLQQRAWAKNYAVEAMVFLISMLTLVFITQIWMNHVNLNHLSLTDIIFLVGGDYKTANNIEFHISFNVIPWLPSAIFGLLVGKILFEKKANYLRRLSLIALSMLFTWFILRVGLMSGWFTFGDFKYPLATDNLNWMAYFCMSKYPPSLDYFLFVLSTNLLAIIGWSKLEQYRTKLVNYLEPVHMFGQCALFFFVVHWFVYYAIYLLLPHKLVSSSGIVACWLLGLGILYIICKKFRDFKMQQPSESFWRLL